MKQGLSNLRKKDLMRGPTVKPNYTYESTAESVRAGNANSYTFAANPVLATLIGAACVFYCAHAADGGNDTSHSADPVYNNISENNSDSYILKAVENASMKNYQEDTKPSREPANKRGQSDLYTYKHAEDMYERQVTSALKDGVLTLKEIEDIDFAAGEWLASYGSMGQTDVNESIKEIMEEIENSVLAGYQGLADSKYAVSYEGHANLTEPFNSRLSEILRSNGEVLRNSTLDELLGSDYENFIGKDKYTVQDLLMVYDTINGIGSVKKNAAYDMTKIGKINKELDGFLAAVDSYDGWWRFFGWGNTTTLLGFKYGYTFPGCGAYDDPTEGYPKGTIELDLREEYLRLTGRSLDVYVRDLNDGEYPVGNGAVPWEVWPLAGMLFSYLRTLAIRSYTRREWDIGDNFGPAFSATIGLLVDSLHPAVFPLRVMGISSLVIEPMRKKRWI